MAALTRRFELLLSVPLILEYEAVLKRREHLAAAGAVAAEIDAILDALAAVSIPVSRAFSWRPQLSDPADEMVLETAVNGYADLLVTFNQTHLRRGAARFGIRSERPSPAISILEA